MVNVQATNGREADGSSLPIQISSSSLGAFLEISPDALVLINQAGIIMLVNQQAEALFGYTRAQLLDQPIERLLPERFREGHREHLAHYFSTPHMRSMGAGFPLFGLHQDGTEFPLDINFKPLLLDERLVALADVRDMSAQQHLETERRQAVDTIHRLASIVESSDDAITGTDLDGTIVSWNKGADQLYGYRAQEVIGKSISLLIPPELSDDLSGLLSRLQRGERITHFETVRMTRDGTRVAVSLTISPIRESNGTIIGASSIARDITYRKQMEGELARRRDEREQIMYKLEAINQQLHGLFEHAPVGLVLFDAHPPYQVLLHNVFFQKFFPEPFYSDGMLGKYLPDYVLRAEEDGVSEVFHEVVSTGQGKTLFNFVYDGMPRGRTWWNWHLAPVIKDGEVTALAQMVIETTHEVLARQQLETELIERRRAEGALKQSRDELVAANEALEKANLARSQFLSTMSHELRTPLTSIVGFSEMLLEDAREAGWSQQHQSNLERILNNSEHLLDLINDVLDLSKIEAGRMVLNSSQVDLRELLRSVTEGVQSIALARHLFLRTEVKEGIDSLETNPGKLYQILLNLVSNALKFTEQGGVTLSASQVVLSGNGTKGIAFAVKDSGIGIPLDLQERIFEAFYQADMSYTRKVGGTGLGLSIARQLTALLGGTLTVESAPGQGSTFTVILPIQAAQPSIGQDLPRLHPEQPQNILTMPPSVHKLVPALVPEVSGQRETTEEQHNLILVVDDNPDAIVLVKSALQDMPYTIIGVQDSLKVMGLAQEMHPCAITLDVMMPELNGWQLLHQLKDHPATASIPVVMVTVLSEQATGYVLGADDYVIKPYTKELLCHTLQRLIEASKQTVTEGTV